MDCRNDSVARSNFADSKHCLRHCGSRYRFEVFGEPFVGKSLRGHSTVLCLQKGVPLRGRGNDFYTITLL